MQVEGGAAQVGTLGDIFDGHRVVAALQDQCHQGITQLGSRPATLRSVFPFCRFMLYS
jgi:hypothetical protein